MCARKKDNTTRNFYARLTTDGILCLLHKILIQYINVCRRSFTALTGQKEIKHFPWHFNWNWSFQSQKNHRKLEWQQGLELIFLNKFCRNPEKIKEKRERKFCQTKENNSNFVGIQRKLQKRGKGGGVLVKLFYTHELIRSFSNKFQNSITELWTRKE